MRYRAVWLMAALIAGFCSFNAFKDAPLAFYVSQALLGCFLMGWIYRGSDKRVGVVALYGFLLYGSTAACGASFSAKSNGWQYLCDAGTGAPVNAITLGIGVLIAGWLIGSGDG